MTQDPFLSYEEAFDRDGKKQSRKERKRLRDKDRSQFKKSDQDQKKKQEPLSLPSQEGHEGRVIAIRSEGILVQHGSHIWTCSLKGSFKLLKERNKNLVAVGDRVYFEDAGNEQGSIHTIQERHSILSRADHLSQHKQQLIAVNVDQVLITTSVIEPPLKHFLIDRYIIAAIKGKLRPMILINKIDLLHEDRDIALYHEVVNCYQALKIPILGVSVKTGEGLDTLKVWLHNQTSVFSGQSGTGKSSLINAIAGTELSTGNIVERTRKGSHTTTCAELLPLPTGGFCIDTPGVQSFGLWEIGSEDLVSYFPEINKVGELCPYADCAHMSEEPCAVKEAVAQGEISPLRFASYCALITSIEKKHHPR